LNCRKRSSAFVARDAQLPNTGLLDDLPSANNFDPLVSRRYAELVSVVSATQSLNLLRLMGVSVIASRRRPRRARPARRISATGAVETVGRRADSASAERS